MLLEIWQDIFHRCFLFSNHHQIHISWPYLNSILHPLKKRTESFYEDHGCRLTSLEYILWKGIKEKNWTLESTDLNKLQTIIQDFESWFSSMFLKKYCCVHKMTLFIIYAYLCPCSNKTNTNNQSGFGPLWDSVPTAAKWEGL